MLSTAKVSLKFLFGENLLVSKKNMIFHTYVQIISSLSIKIDMNRNGKDNKFSTDHYSRFKGMFPTHKFVSLHHPSLLL